MHRRIARYHDSYWFSSNLQLFVYVVIIVIISLQPEQNNIVTCFNIKSKIPALLHSSSLFGALQSDHPIVSSKESITSVITSLLQKNVSTKNLIEEYSSQYIEYVDTAMYKPICGKEALMHKFEKVEAKTIFGCVDNQIVCVNDIVVSLDEQNPNRFQLGLIYKIVTSKSEIQEEMMNEKTCSSLASIGIKLLTVDESKIHYVFDVSRRCSIDSKTMPSKNFYQGQNEFIFDLDELDDLIDNQASIKSSSFHIEKVHLIMKEFFEARNNDNNQQKLNMLTDSSSLECYFANDKISDSLVIDSIIVSNKMSNDNKLKIILTWHVEKNGELNRFERGSSFYIINLENSLIESGIDIMESEKVKDVQAERIRDIINPWWQNRIRDSGLGRFIADSLVKISIPAFALENTDAVANFISLTKKKNELRYGPHKSQTMDLFFPENPDHVKGVVFFVHGGAWGSGEKWMYRLTALPFLEMNMIVVVLGYRTYPDSDIEQQVNDLESALNLFQSTYPQHSVPSTLIGHSSGAHISMLLLLRQLEQRIETLQRSHLFTIDSFISLSGVYSISDHFHYESGRFVEELSPMKPVCGNKQNSFVNYSPTDKFKMFNYIGDIQSPRMLFIHGLNDDTVPFTATQKLVSAMKATGVAFDCTEHYLTGVEHTEVITNLMLDGQSRELVKKWFENEND